MKVLNWKEHKLLILYSLSLILVLAIVDSGITASFRSWLRIQIPNLDKVGHFFGMGILVFLFLKAFVNKNLKSHISKFILIIISMIFFVTIEEFSQKYLVYRTFSYGDLAADYSGIILFTILFFLLIRKSNTMNTVVPN